LPNTEITGNVSIHIEVKTSTFGLDPVGNIEMCLKKTWVSNKSAKKCPAVFDRASFGKDIERIYPISFSTLNGIELLGHFTL
jgi:hypothetical protein